MYLFNLAIRRLKKNKVHTAINIIGLSISLMVSIIILSYTYYHFSFNKYVDDYENSYRITTRLGDGAYWANTFAFKTSLSWWIFALGGFIALGIALLTVSWQSWRAVTRNPVEALRNEWWALCKEQWAKGKENGLQIWAIEDKVAPTPLKTC